MLANVDQQGQCGTILTNVGQCLPMLTNVEQFWPMSANNVDQCWTIFNNFDRCRQIMLTNVEQHPDGFPFWPVITSTLRRWPPFILCSAQQFSFILCSAQQFSFILCSPQQFSFILCSPQQFSHNATNSSTEREEWASDILFLYLWRSIWFVGYNYSEQNQIPRRAKAALQKLSGKSSLSVSFFLDDQDQGGHGDHDDHDDQDDNY